jgi:hypothetical protein
MIKELIYFQTEMFILETMRTVSLKEKEFTNGKMEAFIRENSKKV